MSEPVKKRTLVGGGVVSVALLGFLFGQINRGDDQAMAAAKQYTDSKFEIILEKLKSIDEKIDLLFEKSK